MWKKENARRTKAGFFSVGVTMFREKEPAKAILADFLCDWSLEFDGREVKTKNGQIGARSNR